jgi:tRNA pseudouridine13 synthase
MQRDGISQESFREVSDRCGVAFHGAPRAIALRTDITFQVQEKDVFLRFALGPGQYATTVCREFMKADPRVMS